MCATFSLVLVSSDPLYRIFQIDRAQRLYVQCAVCSKILLSSNAITTTGRLDSVLSHCDTKCLSSTVPVWKLETWMLSFYVCFISVSQHVLPRVFLCVTSDRSDNPKGVVWKLSVCQNIYIYVHEDFYIRQFLEAGSIQIAVGHKIIYVQLLRI
jgi:hypothetical protein